MGQPGAVQFLYWKMEKRKTKSCRKLESFYSEYTVTSSPSVGPKVLPPLPKKMKKTSMGETNSYNRKNTFWQNATGQ